MNEPEKCAWASAYQNRNIVWITTDSGRGACVYDPQGKEAVLGLDADDNALGIAVKDALAHSRFLPIEEAREFLDYRRAEQVYNERIKSLMERYGYNSKAALFGKMKRCDVTLVNGMIEIGPTTHGELDSWVRNKSDGLEDVLVSADAPVERIGAALRLGFSRCIA